MIETEPRIAIVDSCFELVGSRQHGVAAQQKAEPSTRVEWSTKCAWQGSVRRAQIQTSVHVIAPDRYEQ